MKITKNSNFCLWQDLLGYGTLFKNNAWKINANTLENLIRLQEIQKEIDIRDVQLETVFALNDGIARNFDIPQKGIYMILDWMQFIIHDFYLLNHEDKQRGYCGMRGVLSCGERAKLINQDIVTKDSYYLTSEEKRKEYSRVPLIYTPNQLQMNTAFSKAYIIEGSSKIISDDKSQLFIDESVLDKIVQIIHEEKCYIFPVIGELQSVKDSVYEYKMDELQYNLTVNFSKEQNAELVVMASIANKPEVKWEYFVLKFKNVIVYENAEMKIFTRLYIPFFCSSRLTGPSDDNLIIWDGQIKPERPKISMRLSDGEHITGKPELE